MAPRRMWASATDSWPTSTQLWFKASCWYLCRCWCLYHEHEVLTRAEWIHLTDIGSVSACTLRQQYALTDPQPSKHKALNQCWFDAGPAHCRRWVRIGLALSQRLVFAGSVDRLHCVSHIPGCEDIKIVAHRSH